MPPYVKQSATLKCTMGSAQSAMQLQHPTAPVLLCGSPMAGMTDMKPMANIAPFGLCKSPVNPTVAAATAAAGGKLQEMPCVPCAASPWAYAKMNVSVKGQPALTDDSRCVCMWLGVIKVKSAGQKSVIDTAPPPFILEEPPPPAAVTPTAPGAKGAETKTSGTPTPQTTQSGGANVQTPKKGLLSSIQAAVTAAVEKVVDAVKDRVTAVASSVAAAVTAAVGGIFGLRGKGDHAETAASQDAATAEPVDGTDNAAPEAATTITAKLIRYYFNDKRTFGTFQVFRGDEQIFKCYTCEDTVRGDGNPDTVKEWKIENESAIPYGKYVCSFTPSTRYPPKKWEITKVREFDGVRIHTGNNEANTKGCLLLGECVAPDYSMIWTSDITVKKFEKLMANYGNQDFVLEITKDSNGEVAKSEELKSKESNYVATSAKKPTATAQSSKPTTANAPATTTKPTTTAQPSKPTTANVPAATTPTASDKSTGGTQKTSVVGVIGPQDASVGQMVEYQAIFSSDNVSDADRKKVTWAVDFPGKWPVNNSKLPEQGDKLVIEMKQKWYREDILVYARMRVFERKVCQRTSIDPDFKTANANRAKVCATCTFQSEMIGGCRFKESKYGYIIGDVEFNDAAKKLGIEVELMKAIGEKESRGLGFKRIGQATILFERHKMHKHLIDTKKYSSTKINELMEKYPGIVNSENGDYNTSSYEKLKTAKTIDIDCAIKSCSWGRFQVMGENFCWGKYSSPQELEIAMNACDLQQFKYFVAFLEKKPNMLNALLSKDWEKIADCYNGTGWRSKNPTYAGDIEKYYYQFKNNPTKT